jgi:RHS repeat-associated protein
MNRSTPVAVSGVTTATQVAAGAYHSCAVLSDGTVRCWGWNLYGQLGDGTQTSSSTPVVVAGIATATQIDVGDLHSCALLADGTAKCWGFGNNNQFGDGGSGSGIPSGITTATQISTAYDHTCARLADSTVKCWGMNFQGQVGDGTFAIRSTPVAVGGLTSATQLSTGSDSQPSPNGSYSCAVAGGSIACWGTAYSGQLGNGVLGYSLTPVSVAIGGGPPPPPQQPPPPEQSIGSCNGYGRHANNGSACQNDPVNSLTGAFTTSAVDLRLAGIGVPFSWRRSYTSSDTTAGSLGPAWTYSYATSLAIQGNGDVVLRGDEGQQVYYTKQADNSFVGAAGALSVLSLDGGGYKLVRRDQVVYRFDAQGRLTSLKDRNSQGLTFAYDGSGQLQTITDSVGRSIAITHSAGLLTRVTLPDGRYVEYSYTGGRLSSVRDARGGTTLYTYEAGGRLKTIVDQNNHTVVDNTYGADGRVIQQVDARGKVGAFSWDEPTQTATYTDARQNEWKDVYEDNLLVERIDPLGNSTLFDYDAGLNVTTVTDPRGNAVVMTYDTRGNMLTRTAPVPLSYQETWTYNARNDPITYRDRRGNTTDFGYDGAGNLTSVAGPDADGPGPLGRPQTLYGRDPAGTGLVTSLTDPRGKQTTFTYSSGNLTEIRTQLGNRTTLGYDGSGRLTSLVDPRGNAAGANPADYRWAYSYNEADHLRTQTDPLGHVTELQYDPGGNLAWKKDANLRVTSYGYDAANHLTSVTAPDPDGGGPLAAPVTQYTYDDVGNLATRKDANLRETVYGWDDANRLVAATGPLNRAWTYSYDPNGNLTQVVDANGNATPTGGDGHTTYGYDAINRLTSIGYSDATPDVTFGYDGNDNRTQMTDGSGTETASYDPLDRLTAVTRGSNTFSYAYDLLNLTQLTYPGGTSTSYAYDDDERLQSATSGGLATTYAYDEAANLRTTTLPSASQLVETGTYDRAGALVDVESKRGATVRARFAITRDPVGNPTQIVRTGALAQTQTYTYDAMDRLTGVCFQAGTCPGGSDPFVRWSYDGVGNRLTESRPTGTTSYTYNAADELTQAGSTAYTYDQNGNVLSAGSRTFAWDLANRLQATTLSPTTTTYLYDGLGKRLQASTGTAASAKTNFLWEANRALPQVAQERNGSNSLLRQYTYGQARIRQTQGTASYYLYDGLGSVVTTTSSTGSVQRTWSYEPYGPIRTQSGTSPTNFWQFTGEYLDPTGHYHLRARQYEPASGRFLSRDPLAAPRSEPGASAYLYTANRPTVLVDPSGMIPIADTPEVGSASANCQAPSSKVISAVFIVGGFVPIAIGAKLILLARSHALEAGLTGLRALLGVGESVKVGVSGGMNVVGGLSLSAFGVVCATR